MTHPNRDNAIPAPPDLDQLSSFAFDTKETARILKCSAKKLEADRYHDRGLPFTKFGGLVRYIGSDILDALMSNRHVPGGE